MYELICFSLSSLILRIKSLTSLSNAFSLVRYAIKEFPKTFLMILSNVGIRGLAVRGMLILDDAASEASIGAAGGSVARDESPNLNIFTGFLDGILILFVEIVLYGEEFKLQTNFDLELKRCNFV